jgi:CheY-like chemotaxis protein
MTNILIVEDDTDIRTFLERATQRMLAGAVVYSARNGLEAITFLQQASFDLVMSDHHMPQMTGLDLLRTLRSYGSQVPFVLITADPNAGYAAIAEGANAFFPKPLTIKDLQSIFQLIQP